MIYETNKLEDSGVMIKKSLKGLLQEKETPWYLEAKDALRFDNTLQKYEVDSPVTMSEDLEVRKDSFYEDTLNIGTFLTFVGEAGNGNLMIQEPKMVFSGEGSFDKMVKGLKSDSEFYMFYSKIFGTVAVGIAVVYGVDFVRKVVLPFMRKRKDLRKKRSDDGKSDNSR